MKKRMALLLVLAMTGCLFAGCGSGGGDAGQAPSDAAEAPASDAADGDAAPAESTGSGGGYTIALCNNSLGETWRYQMVAEFEQAAEELKEQGVIKE